VHRVEKKFILLYPEDEGSRFSPQLWYLTNSTDILLVKGKGKGLQQQAEVAQGVPGKLRPRIILTFGTTKVVGRQP
jgi:hypothetical protein